MTSAEPSAPTSRFATVSAVISSAAAVVAAACAIISTSQVLNTVQTDAQEKLFALKLDACLAFADTATTISTNPIAAASDIETRRKAVNGANRLMMIFPDQVRDASLKFINHLDIVYAARPTGPQDLSFNGKLASLTQAAIDLQQACQSDIAKTARISE